MMRFAKALPTILTLVGFLGGAIAAYSAEKIECVVMEGGKKATKLVASREECTKLGGKVSEPESSKPKPGEQ